MAVTEALESRVLLAAPNPVDLTGLDGGDGFRLEGIADGDQIGYSVSNAGDVNGDGFDDLLVGAHGLDTAGGADAGGAYVIFGAENGFPAAISAADLDGTNGFAFHAAESGDNGGYKSNTAGDINGDGFDDIIIGAKFVGDDDRGAAYVLLGHQGNFPAVITPTDLDGTNGFTMFGVEPNDQAGFPVAPAGDVNGDGLDDFLVGADYAEEVNRGSVYVVFGQRTPFSETLDLAALNGTNGFAVLAAEEGDGIGRSMTTAGDVNGDGFDDLILGAWFAEQPGGDTTGESYIIFGKASGFSAKFSVADLDGSNGFTVVGIDTRDRSGRTVSNAGDINADGYDDVIISALYADPGGETYVVFGHAGVFPALIEASNLDGVVGFTLRGEGGSFGRSVSGAGDVNGDGFDDLLVGAPYANDDGAVYIVFGHSGAYPVEMSASSLDGTNGFRLTGAAPDDPNVGRAARIAGDVNGDGFEDIITSTVYADHSGGTDQGKAYVYFGGNFTGGIETQVGDGNGNTLRANRGANAADILIGGNGYDTLISDGGDDVLRGGQHNDILSIPDADFSGTRRLQGGNGIDMLRLTGSGIHLDLTTISDNRITDIERIDIRGDGANQLTLNLREVLNISTHRNTLVVRREVDDTVDMGSGWTQQSDETLFGKRFNVFTQGVAVLKVEADPGVAQGFIDVVGRNSSTGTLVVGVSDGTQFNTQSAGVIPPGVDWDELVTGDFNGDGFTDLAGLSPSDGQWRVLLATSNGFTNPQIWAAWNSSVTYSDVLVGDFNNDGRDDVAGRASTGTWVVGLSNGSQFATSSFGAWSTSVTWLDVNTGDFDGDGLADIVGRASTGTWVVGRSTGTSFQMMTYGAWSTNVTWQDVSVGDLNADGTDDVIGRASNGRWVAGISDGTRFNLQSFGIWSTNVTWQNVTLGDVNNDGRDDVISRASTGTWVVGLSNGSTLQTMRFGAWSTTTSWDIVPGDFNGDGLLDMAGRDDYGRWWIARSNGSRFLNEYWNSWSATVAWDNILPGEFRA